MRFGEFVETLPPDKMIKLGAIDGSGFFYCGSAGDILANMESYNEMLLRRMKKIMRKCENRISQLENILAIIEDPKIREYNEHELIRRKNRLKDLNNLLETFTDLSEREIIEHYPSIEFDGEAVIIIVKGCEYGSYWSLDEVKSPMAFSEFAEAKQFENYLNLARSET